MDTLLFVRALILVLPSDSIQDRRFGDAAARRQPEPCTNAVRQKHAAWTLVGASSVPPQQSRAFCALLSHV